MARSIIVQKTGVSSIARLVGTVNLIIGLVVGFLGAIAAIVSYLHYNSNGFLADAFISVGILLVGVVVYPLVLFALGWLYGALVALIFNLVIGVSGGVELTVADEVPAARK
jgi:hypothetical protein